MYDIRAVPFKYIWEGGMPLISDPPPTPTNRKKNGIPPSQVDLNGTALTKFKHVFFSALVVGGVPIIGNID